MAQAIAHPHANQVRTASGLDVIASIWLFISAFAVTMTPAEAWSNAIAGVVVFVFSIIRTSGAYGQSWLSWINALIGLWVFFSPWILGSPTGSVMANNLITGGVIFLLGLWSALATTSENRRVPA